MFNSNFYNLIHQKYLDDPRAPCIETDAGTKLDRSWLEAKSARYANVLKRLGCAPGDRVATQVEKSAQALALYFACLRSGLCFVPINTAYRSAELSYLLDDSAPRLFVTEQSNQVLPPNLKQPPLVLTLNIDGSGSLEELASIESEQFETVQCDGDSIATLIYTSGTTGRPKGAMISHRATSFTAVTLAQVWKISGADTLLHALPVFHAHGLMISSNVILAAGGQMIFHRSFDAEKVIESLPRATVLMGVPTFYHRLLLDDRLSTELCRNMRLFTCGSAPLSAEVHKEFEKRTGNSIVERYGTTETLIITSNPYDGERIPGAVGMPIPGVEVRIANKEGDEFQTGDIGLIQVRGLGLFSGYWNMPEQTKKEFVPGGWFNTGDLGFVGENGYVKITGRAKDLVISGGYNVYPAEVESTLDEMPEIRESAIVGTPHPDFGEAVVAFVIPRDHASPPSSADVIQWAKGRLANYKVPKQVHVVRDLPRNALGKVLKTELREMLASGKV